MSLDSGWGSGLGLGWFVVAARCVAVGVGRLLAPGLVLRAWVAWVWVAALALALALALGVRVAVAVAVALAVLALALAVLRWWAFRSVRR